MTHDFVLHARQRGDKTEAILDAAVQLVATQGLEALTLSRVAGSLGIVTTAIYRYFKSKDALLAALQRRAIAALHARYQQSMAPLLVANKAVSPKVAALTALFGTARFYAALPETEPENFGLVSRLLSIPSTLIPDDEAAQAVPLVAAFLQSVGTRIDAAVTAGALEAGDAMQRTLGLWATFHGLTQLGKLKRVAPHVNPDALVDASAHTILRGWGASAEDLEQAHQALAKAIKKKAFAP